MTELEKLRDELARERWAARHDFLTGLLNRRGLHEHLEAVTPPAALALVDLDLFSRFNRAAGLWEAGDRALQLLTSILTSGRATDVVGRWGGDEFLLLFPDTDPAGAAARLTRFLDESSRRLRIGEHRITFSAGIAAVTHAGGWRPAFAAAASAVVAAKDGGRAAVLVA